MATESQAKNLFWIDPATGGGTSIALLAEVYEGLTLSDDGKLFGAKDKELWSFDLDGGNETKVGQHLIPELEALQYAFGDNEPRIQATPYVPASWTQEGIRFGFSPSSNTFLILRPSNGAATQYSCAFDMIDVEGLVFVTQRNDPLYGLVAGFD